MGFVEHSSLKIYVEFCRTQVSMKLLDCIWNEDGDIVCTFTIISLTPIRFGHIVDAPKINVKKLWKLNWYNKICTCKINWISSIIYN